MSSDTFVYFDNAHTYGALNGTIQVELTAHALDATSDGTVDLSVKQVARLRCNIAAAKSLMAALEGAIKMAEKSSTPPPEVNKVN